MTRQCDVCSATYEAKRSTSRYCSGMCRTRASRSGRNGARVVPLAPVAPAQPVGSVVDATRAELESAGRAESPLGLAALALAARIDSQQDTGSGLAAAVRALGETLAAALKGSEAASTLDELKARRRAKRGA
jgi:hypothetical protein